MRRLPWIAVALAVAVLAAGWWWTRGDAGAPGAAPPAPATRVAPAPPAPSVAPAGPMPSAPSAPSREPVPIPPVAAIPPPVDLPGEVVDVAKLTPEQSARRRQRGVIAARLDQVLRNDTSPDGRAQLAEIVLQIRDVNLRRTAENDHADELARLRREFEDIAAERYSEVMGRLADPTQWRPPRDAAASGAPAAGSPAR
jgi:hypothetical protein